MIKRKIKWKGLDVLEIHYLDDLSYLQNFKNEKIDIVKLYQINTKINKELDSFYTLKLDLTQDKDKIFKSFKKNTKYEINRVSRDKECSYSFYSCIDDDEIENFISDYKKFMAFKNHYVNFDFYEQQLKDFKQNVIFTNAIVNSKPIVSHVYFCDGDRARLSSSISARSDTGGGTRT